MILLMGQWWHPNAWSSGGFSKPALPPLEIPDLVLWHESSRSNERNGSNVSSFKDHSNNRYHATQTTAANQATIIQNGINGLQSLSFDATNDTYDYPALAKALTKSITGFTLIAIVKPNIQTTGTRTIWVSSIGTGSGGRINLSQNASSAQFSCRRLDADSAQTITASGLTANTWSLITSRVDYSNTTAKLRVNNGVETVNTSFLTSGSTSNTNSSVMAIGSSGAGGLYWNGEMALILAYRRCLTDEEISKIRVWCNQRFKTQLV